MNDENQIEPDWRKQQMSWAQFDRLHLLLRSRIIPDTLDLRHSLEKHLNRGEASDLIEKLSKKALDNPSAKRKMPEEEVELLVERILKEIREDQDE